MYLWLIHVDVWQKTTQRWKAKILQLKIKNIFFLREGGQVCRGVRLGLPQSLGNLTAAGPSPTRGLSDARADRPVFEDVAVGLPGSLRLGCCRPE